MFRRTLVVIIFLFCALPLAAEYLFLKDGSIVKGRVVSETATAVNFRSDEDKKVARYPREQVMRVLYTEINMGRIYLQLKSGKNMRVYMVDEDRLSYTFRNELNKPEEFKINRADVLFIAERNPSGLNGEAGYTDVMLEWFPPFDKMRNFNIYIKKSPKDEYELAATSRNNSHRLRALEEGTKYYISVTGIDRQGDETPRSNELEITTLKKERKAPSEGEQGETKLIFTPAVLFPFGVFSEMGLMGYGGFVSYNRNNLFMKNLRIGLEAGYFYIPGVTPAGVPQSKFDSIHFAPFGLKAGYTFNIGNNIALTPALLAGGAFVYISYSIYDSGSSTYEDKTALGVDPAALASVSLEWNFSERLFLGINGGCGLIYETKKILYFAYSGVNIGVRF